MKCRTKFVIVSKLSTMTTRLYVYISRSVCVFDWIVLIEFRLNYCAKSLTFSSIPTKQCLVTVDSYRSGKKVFNLFFVDIVDRSKK